jgi:flagellar hook-associated protein 2
MTSVTTPTASTLITSTGIGSGLNISGIVSALTSSYGAAQTDQLTSKQNSLDAQVSAYGSFTSAIDTLKLTLPALEDHSQLAGFAATVADKTIASATTTPAAVAGQYSLLVTNLAKAATLTSQHYASAATVVGTGSLTIAVGGASTSISIDTADNTLAGIASAINSAANNPGVTASIITTSDGARLILAGTATGAANAITVTQSGGDGGLSTLTSLTTTQAAQDASFSINGFPATSASNQVSKAITGVTLNLLLASAPATPTTVSITPDTTGAQASIAKFVTALNGVLSSIHTLTGYDPSTKTAGPLNGNATLGAFQNQLANILDKVTTGGSGAVKSLADLGITANAGGSYDTNSTTLGNALTASLASIGNLLGGAHGIATQLANLIDGYTKPGGLLDTINHGLQSSLSSVAKEQAALAARLATYSTTLTREYNAMDAAVAQLKQTQTYLTAEFNPNQAISSGSNSNLSSGNLNT